MSVERNDTFTPVTFPAGISSSDGAFCRSRSSVAPSHRFAHPPPSEVPKTLPRAAMIKTSESFRGFVKCPRNRIKEPRPDRGLGVQRAKRGAERRCSGALPRSTQEGDTGEGSGSAKGEGKLAVANRSGEQWQRRHPSKSAAHDRPPTRHIKRKSGSEQTCDAGLALRLGPYFLK